MDRIPGYSDEMMYRQSELLHGIVFKTKLVKSGRGKNAVMIEQRCYEHSEIVERRAVDSLSYYKDRMENKKTKIKFIEYQRKIIVKGSEILILKGFLYLTMEVRTGKTLTSLGIAKLQNKKNVLFVTKKKAISSIENDYDLLNPDFSITIINYESLHKVEGVFDLVILDEAHSMGAFPKPSKRAKQVKELLQKSDNPNVILLSGTPTPESYSQMYHQVF